MKIIVVQVFWDESKTQKCSKRGKRPYWPRSFFTYVFENEQ